MHTSLFSSAGYDSYLNNRIRLCAKPTPQNFVALVRSRERGIFTPCAKTPAQGEHSELFGKENPVVGVIKGLWGSVIVVDEGSVKKRKDINLAENLKGVDRRHGATRSGIQHQQSRWAKIHGTRL